MLCLLWELFNCVLHQNTKLVSRQLFTPFKKLKTVSKYEVSNHSFMSNEFLSTCTFYFDITPEYFM